MQSSNPVLNRSSAFAPGQGQAYPGAAPYGQPGRRYGGPGMPPQQYQGAPADSRPMTLDDVIVKTAATLGVVVVAAAIAWWHDRRTNLVTPVFLAGALLAFVIGDGAVVLPQGEPGAGDGVRRGRGCVPRDRQQVHRELGR